MAAVNRPYVIVAAAAAARDRPYGLTPQPGQPCVSVSEVTPVTSDAARIYRPSVYDTYSESAQSLFAATQSVLRNYDRYRCSHLALYGDLDSTTCVNHPARLTD